MDELLEKVITKVIEIKSKLVCLGVIALVIAITSIIGAIGLAAMGWLNGGTIFLLVAALVVIVVENMSK